MDFTQTQKEAAKFLEKIAPIYQKYFLRDGNGIFREQFEDGYKALFCFLNYAYARNVAPPAYSKIAHKCISEKYQNGNKWGDLKQGQNDAEDLWKEYKRIAKNLKVNDTHNPMNVNGGVVAQLASSGIPNIAVYVKGCIKGGNTAGAHKFIKDIRGVGEKIASFYLRDIAYLADDLDEKNIPSDLYLLQPMDTWLKQTFRILFNSNVPEKLQEGQELIVELCKQSKVSSVAFNQGAWVLGSQVAGEFGRLEEALNNHGYAQEIIQDHIKEKQGYLDVVKDVLNSLRAP